jgi:hypothetical protein
MAAALKHGVITGIEDISQKLGREGLLNGCGTVRVPGGVPAWLLVVIFGLVVACSILTFAAISSSRHSTALAARLDAQDTETKAAVLTVNQATRDVAHIKATLSRPSSLTTRDEEPGSGKRSGAASGPREDGRAALAAAAARPASWDWVVIALGAPLNTTPGAEIPAAAVYTMHIYAEDVPRPEDVAAYQVCCLLLSEHALVCQHSTSTEGEYVALAGELALPAEAVPGSGKMGAVPRPHVRLRYSPPVRFQGAQCYLSYLPLPRLAPRIKP